MSAKVISGSKFSFNGAYKPYYISAAIVLLLAITFFTMIRVVGTGQVGVVTQYGRVTGRELTEGMSFVAPWGINNVTMYDVQDVSSQIVLNYTLDRNSVSKVHQTIGATYVDKVISPAINEVFKAASAEYTASELITRRSEVKNDAQTTLTERLKPLGINVSQLSIVDFRFSDNFSKAIEEKQVAQQNAERAKFNLDAAFTDAQAQKAQSETLTAEYLQKQAIEKWDGKLPTYLGSDTVFNIPLK
jgi:prohibitin 1